VAWVNIQDLVAANPPPIREARQVLEHLARRAKARFYADENFAAPAVAILRAMGAKVGTAQKAGLTRHPDENHAAFALRKGLVLITCDRDFLNERLHPLIHCPAIFVFDFGTGSEIEIRQAFRCLAAVLQMPQFFDKWWKVDAKRDGWHEQARHLNGATSRDRMRLWRGRLQQWVDEP